MENWAGSKITSGIRPHELVQRTVEFVRAQLPHWRDDPAREPVNSENQLNSQLAKFLSIAARLEFPMVQFVHQELQPGHSSVDLAATPTEHIQVGSRGYSIYDPVLLLEGKRLPAPARSREREYVMGHDGPTGGIQRFKLGRHGRATEIAAMLGYIQEGTVEGWRDSINCWLSELAGRTEAGVAWTDDEALLEVETDATAGAATHRSSHGRVQGISEKVHLYHLWVELTRAFDGETL